MSEYGLQMFSLNDLNSTDEHVATILRCESEHHSAFCLIFCFTKVNQNILYAVNNEGTSLAF